MKIKDNLLKSLFFYATKVINYSIISWYYNYLKLIDFSIKYE